MCSESTITKRNFPIGDFRGFSMGEEEGGVTFLTPGEMEGHFGQLIEALAGRGLPSELIYLFEAQRTAVLSRAAEMPFVKGEIPFLMGIPVGYLSFEEQAGLFSIALSDALPSLKLGEFFRKPGIPSQPYFLFGIENGRENIGCPWEVGARELEGEKRQGLAAEELFALHVQNRVLVRHFILACPEKMVAQSMVPGLNFVPGVGPRLELRETGKGFPEWGTPSCYSRECFL